ncbi:hypothetical protein F2Q70_00018759 [Brassica cretica]|uniref:Two-component response regulator-like APRR5 n=1 Tax=Brassica cretica TaxID=69181 RepID=A0A8S9I5B8_BRACR|nr:hypothetical protein F2Q70_00018759 [Brassica cretica]
MQEMSDEVVEVTVVEKAAEANGEKSARRRMRRKDAAEGGDGLMKWERFLPKISLRVLLVEADESTRQIVSALLRKCSYRVAAVADGLKAWEMLKGKPESVDLILTEVDLPSISGYALLTLIMENDTCKNIPVIMMSTQDSVNTVYKCMLKGAADYLVKPLRRNELRNLWQHVWRRQSSQSLVPGSFPTDESVGHEKPEGASANNSTSNQETAFERDQRPVIGNGGDDQSSCSRPEMQGESADVEDSTKEAIDFMGASFRRNTQGNREESVARYESMIELDLSLRRPNTCENQSSGERPSLHPSSASAFTRYVHRPQCLVSPLVTNQRKNFNTAAMAPASLSPSPSSVSPHEYSSMFHPFNGSMDAEERRHVSSATELSAIGNDCNANSSSVGKNQQSLQREAALNKFRMKRKDRCFDKKVRYESRKKLAEQRPRIKGQFVRQVQSTETSTQEAPQ